MATSIDRARNSLSNEDFDVLFKTFKNENFLKHLEEAAKQINEPKKWNQLDYESKKFENIREGDTTYLLYTPGFALQTRRADNDSTVYINIVVSDNIDNPNFSCAKEKCDASFKRCFPHAILDPRLEFGTGKLFSEWLSANEASEAESISTKIKQGGIWVLDVVVSPLCLSLARENSTAKHHVIETVLEGIKNLLKLKLINVKTIGFDLYVGNPVGPQMKGLKNSASVNNVPLCKNENDKSTGFACDTKILRSNSVFPNCPSNTDIPKYKLKHVNNVSLQDYSIVRNSKPKSLRPQSLIVEVMLPGILSASEIDVEVSGKEFHLKTEKSMKYKLDIDLPYEVEEEPKKAKFNISLNILEIELSVLKETIPKPTKDLFGSDVDMLPKYPVKNDASADCESGYRTNSDCDTSSVSSHEEITISDLENDIETTQKYLSPLVPVYTLTQSDKFLFISVDLKNIDVKSMKLRILDLKSFKFSYKIMKTEEGPVLYEENVSVAPHSFKKDGVTYHFLEKTMLIQVEKSEGGMWTKIKVGKNDKYLSKCKTNEENVFNRSKDIVELEVVENERVQEVERVSEPLPIRHQPCNNELATENNNDKSSVSYDKNLECKNIKISAETKEDIAAFFKQPLLPRSHYTQSNRFLLINIKCKNVNIQNFVVEQIDSKTFKYQYKHSGSGFAPLFYGGYVYTAPHTFKNKGVTHQILEDTLVIQVEKKKPLLWSKIKVGMDRKTMKEIKLKGLESMKKEVEADNELQESSSGDRAKDCVRSRTQSLSEDESETLGDTEGERATTLVAATTEETTSKSSSEVKIPQLVRRTSDCFLTGSWPRGILKARSRSLSESQMDHHLDSYNNGFGSSLECEDEVVMEEPEDYDDALELEEGGGSTPTKKSVRFNEFVRQEIFKVDSSILGQKAKNQKKASQRKRARERRISEGSQSSENETATDVATTEDESNTEGESVSSGAEGKKGTRERVTKKRKEKSKKNKKNNKKPVLNLSSEITEMVFQLDDD